MAHYVFVHQKRNLPDLRDEYPTKEEALEALREMSQTAVKHPKILITSRSGMIAFKAEDFGGAEYRDGV